MLAALEQYKRDIIKYMERDISREFEELSSMMLWLSPRSVAASLWRYIDQDQRSYSGGARSSATYEDYEKEVIKQWTKVTNRAQRIFGSKNVRKSGGRIWIRLWDGGNTTVNWGSYNEVQRNGVRKFKGIFAAILRTVIGSGEYRKLQHTASSGGYSYRRTGSGAFRSGFQLSHRSGTAGEQVSSALLDETGLKKDDATMMASVSKSAEMRSYNAGKAKFYELAETNMMRVMAAATFIKLGNKTDTVRTPGGVRAEMPGDFVIELTFDNAAFNVAYGLGTLSNHPFKKDIHVLRREWNNWAENFMPVLLGEIADDLWELKGSTSRRESYEILQQQVVEKQLLKGGKGFKLKRVSGKAPKVKAKAQMTKDSAVGKKRPQKRTRHKVNTKRPRTKSGRPDMRYKANKQAFGKGASSPIALMSLLQKALPGELRKEMTGAYPKGLEWRTGRFGTSARIQNIVPTGNMTTIQYTYQRNPYEVFEPGSGSPLASAGRDPQALIGGTIREIAQSIMGTRFGLIRTTRV